MLRIVHVRLWLFLILSTLIGSMSCEPCWALSLNEGQGVKTPVSLNGHMSVFRDPKGELTIDDIVARDGRVHFEPLSSMLSEGYRKGAVWVHFSLAAEDSADRWLLQVERPLIEQVNLYAPDGAGHIVAVPPGLDPGRRGPVSRAFPTVFPIPVSGVTTDYYIRLQSATSLTTSFQLWQAQGYEASHRSDDWIAGILIGAIAAMMFANLLYAAWLKDSLYLLYVSVLFTVAATAVFRLGYASEILHFLSPDRMDRVWGTIVCLSSVAMTLLMSRLFQFRRNWIWAGRIFQVVALLNAVASLFAMAGYYGVVAHGVTSLQIVSTTFGTVFVAYLIIVRRQLQYLLPAAAFAVLAVSGLKALLQISGITAFHVDGPLAGPWVVATLLHLILLNAAVAKRTRVAERNYRKEKDRVLALSQEAERDLTIKVRERTAELAGKNAALSAEVDRRHLLETRLRQSLDTVNEALSQQRDFVALVSHEFRGPLAVIDASATNLALFTPEDASEVTPRVAKIRRTVRRMSMLIENVLAGDRIDSGRTLSVRITAFDVNDVLRAIRADLDDDAARRVQVIGPSEAMALGDRALLEIALQNVVRNSLKYSPPTSTVTVSLKADRDSVLVDVSDRGSGVAEADRERIFLKYYRAAEQPVPGSGLGLYIAKEIARQNGGDLTLAANGPGGSAFRFSLRAAKPACQTSPRDPVLPLGVR